MTWFIGALIGGQVYPVTTVLGEYGAEHVDVYRAQTSSWKANDEDLKAFQPKEGVSYLKVGGHWNHYETLSRLLRMDNVAGNVPLLQLVEANPWAPAKMAEVSMQLDEKGNIAAILQNGVPVEDDVDEDTDESEDEKDLNSDEDNEDTSNSENSNDETTNDTPTDETSDKDNSDAPSVRVTTVTIRITPSDSDKDKSETDKSEESKTSQNAPKHSSGKYTEDSVKKFEELDAQLQARLKKLLGME